MPEDSKNNQEGGGLQKLMRARMARQMMVMIPSWEWMGMCLVWMGGREVKEKKLLCGVVVP